MPWENCRAVPSPNSSHMCWMELSLKGVLALASAVKGLWYTGIFPVHWPDGYAMLMSPNKGETAVHGCHCRAIWLCACVRYWPGRGLVYVCSCNYFSFFVFSSISNLGELETVMKAISKWNTMKTFTQTPIRLSYDSCYNNQGLQTKQLCNSR